MPIENKFERAPYPDHPDRCQATTAKGQCPYLRKDPSKYCAMHGGNKAAESQKANMLRQYQLTQVHARIGNLAEHEQLKGLRDEVAISRYVMETILNQCKDATDLMLYSSKISEFLTKIEKLVVSCNRLEASQGQLLDKSAILHLAARMVEIIGKYVSDDDTLSAITNEFVMEIANLNGKEDET